MPTKKPAVANKRNLTLYLRQLTIDRLDELAERDRDESEAGAHRSRTIDRLVSAEWERTSRKRE